MKRNTILLILLILCFYSCSPDNQRVHYFDKFDSDKWLQNKNALICSLKVIYDTEKKITIHDSLNAYQYDFSEKMIEHEGIYRKFTDKYILNYRLDSLGKGLFDIEGNGRGLLFKVIIYDGIKNYKINKRPIEVYRFDESTGSGGLTTYYIKDFGFIAYVSSGNGYYLCTKLKGHDFLNNRELREIGNILVSDTNFFAIYNYRNLPD